AYPSHSRTQALAAITALWSRSYLYLADSALLVSRGSYPSTLPLIRAACEAIAAEEQLRASADEMEQHHIWLYSTLKPSELHKAFEFELRRFLAGEVLASDPALRGIYRPVTASGRPSF